MKTFVFKLSYAEPLTILLKKRIIFFGRRHGLLPFVGTAGHYTETRLG